MIRFTTFTLLSSIAAAAQAQYPGGMSDADMQKMMQGMQEMQACMADIDQAAMERMGKEAEQMHAEVKALCADGKRDAAQARAVDFGMKAAKDPAMKAMAECGKKMQGVMPQMQQATAAPTVEELQNRHVCDES
jgi:hypothetical protein